MENLTKKQQKYGMIGYFIKGERVTKSKYGKHIKEHGEPDQKAANIRKRIH